MNNLLQFGYRPVRKNQKQWYMASAWIFSTLYAFSLARLPIGGYVDRDNYLNYFTDSWILLGININNGFSTLFQNEPVWLLINAILGSFFQPDVALRLLIFASALLFCISLLRSGKCDPRFFVFAAIVCLLPQIMKNYVVHLRQGVAIALFMFALSAQSPIVRRVGSVLTPLIHSSFFFVSINYLFTRIVNKYSSVSRVPTFIIMLLVVCAFNLFLLFLMDSFNARQINEMTVSSFESRSGSAFFFWSLILIIFFSSGIRFGIQNFFAIASITSYLILYFLFAPIARVFESTLPFVLLTGYQLKSSRKLLFFLLVGILFVYQWLVPILTGGDVFRLAQ